MGKTVTSPTGGQASDTSQPKYKKVFVQRDYSQGTGVKYQTTFPTELEGFVEPELFAFLINTINCIYDEGKASFIFRLSRSLQDVRFAASSLVSVGPELLRRFRQR